MCCGFLLCCRSSDHSRRQEREEKEEDPRVDEAENRSGNLNFDALFVACVSLFAGGLEVTTGEGRKESHHC